MSTEPKIRNSIAPRYASGDTIAERYRLEEVIGEGGMGTVWLARNVTLDAPVALKLIRQGLESDEAADRLLEEARAAAKIEHSAIVRVFDFGETELGDPYIVMELLEGQSLAETLDARHRIEPAALVATLLPVIDGLRCAHEAGVVHRDLKPSNIFLSWEGSYVQPKVVDFGVAKTDRRDAFPKLTRQGTVLGSPAYMAPEQARGQEDVDHRADVWTISVVLYEAITGAAAFSGTNYNAVMRSVIEDDIVPITELGIPEANDSRLWEILSRGLSKDRHERFQSMESLGRALAEWLFHQGITEDICGTSIEDAWLSGGDPGTDDTELVPAVFALSRRRVSRTASSFDPPVESASTRAFVRERSSLPPSRPFMHSVYWPIAVAAAVGLTMFIATFTVVRAIREDPRWLNPALSTTPAARHSAVLAPPPVPPAPSASKPPSGEAARLPPTVFAPRTFHAPPPAAPQKPPPITDALGVAPLGMHPALRRSPPGPVRADPPPPAHLPANQTAGKTRPTTPGSSPQSVAVPATSWPLPASGLPAWAAPEDSGAELKDPYR